MYQNKRDLDCLRQFTTALNGRTRDAEIRALSMVEADKYIDGNLSDPKDPKLRKLQERIDELLKQAGNGELRKQVPRLQLPSLAA